jgi:hypothetical protein
LGYGLTALRVSSLLIDGDRYFLSDRIKTLKAIRAKIRPEPACEPLHGPRSAMPSRRRTEH